MITYLMHSGQNKKNENVTANTNVTANRIVTAEKDQNTDSLEILAEIGENEETWWSVLIRSIPNIVCGIITCMCYGKQSMKGW